MLLSKCQVCERSLAASELQRLLAERGMVISAGKMSGLWSGQPNAVKLDELDVICAVLGCDVGELLLPEPVAVPEPAASQSTGAVADARAVTPGPGPAGPCHPSDQAIGGKTAARMAAASPGPGGLR